MIYITEQFLLVTSLWWLILYDLGYPKLQNKSEGFQNSEPGILDTKQRAFKTRK